MLWLFVEPTRVYLLDFLLQYSVFIYCWVLIFALSSCYILIYMFLEMMHWEVRGLSHKPNIYVSWSISELRVRLALWNRFKPSSEIFYWLIQGGTSFVDHLCFCSVLCLLCLCARLFICALWSPAGKGLTSWPSFVVSNCEFVTFPFGSFVECGTLIVSIPDLCILTYFRSLHAG